MAEGLRDCAFPTLSAQTSGCPIMIYDRSRMSDSSFGGPNTFRTAKMLNHF